MTGAQNIRDIGGLRSADNRSVRRTAVIRSANLDNLSQHETDQLLDTYAISAIFDLRGRNETRRERPIQDRVPVYQLAALGGFRGDEVAAYFKNLSEDAPTAFSSLYMHICEASGPAFKTIFQHLADYPHCTLLVHCELGKDRTGVFVAILLLLLDVPDEDIIHDYQLSQEEVLPLVAERSAKLRQHPLVVSLTITPSALKRHFLALPESMQLFLQLFRAKYGDVLGYLRSIHVDDEVVAAVRMNLISN